MVQIVWEKYYRNGKLPRQTRKGSFWWRDNLKNLDHFKEMASVQLQCGDSILFWHDNWNGQNLKTEATELYSYAKNRFINAQKVISQGDITRLFTCQSQRRLMNNCNF